MEERQEEIQTFFIDLDCQFLMVPKKLINFILLQRLLKVLKRLVTLITPQNSLCLEIEENKFLSKSRIEFFYQKQF